MVKMRMNKSKSWDSIVMIHFFTSFLFRVSVFSEEEPDLNNELEISVSSNHEFDAKYFVLRSFLCTKAKRYIF